VTPAKLVLSQSTRFEFKHQPLNLLSASGRYTWGDDSPEDARRRGKVVERRRERLEGEGWNIIRDKNAMRSGDLISGFMKRIGRADRVIVVLSDKYLRSPYCMTELHIIYRRSNEEKEEFLVAKDVRRKPPISANRLAAKLIRILTQFALAHLFVGVLASDALSKGQTDRVIGSPRVGGSIPPLAIPLHKSSQIKSGG
jgi:hypothetical protein